MGILRRPPVSLPAIRRQLPANESPVSAQSEILNVASMGAATAGARLGIPAKANTDSGLHGTATVSKELEQSRTSEFPGQ